MNNEIDPNKPLTVAERVSLGVILFWVIFGFVALMNVCGCATKTRNVEIDGMFTQAESATIAIGSVDVMASPIGEETAIIKYSEDTAWLSPSTKTHEFKIQLTGSNCVDKVDRIVDHICQAFVPTAAIVNGANATSVTNVVEEAK